MSGGLRRTVLTISVLALAGGLGAAVAQQRPWVDPPAEGAAPPAPPPAVEAPAPVPQVPAPPQAAAPAPTPPTQSAEPAPRAEPETRSAQQRDRSPSVAAPRRDPAEAQRARQEAAAQELVQEYLAFWSAPNHVALETTRDFYAGSVNFHGREMSARALLEEKRRFARRWPERNYRPRPESMAAACDVESELCTVRSVFDFHAADPQRGKRSAGTGTIELVVSFAGRQPVIVSENSSVDRRGTDRTVSLEELSD